MNRREFLAGFFASGIAATAVPQIAILEGPATDLWQQAIGKVLQQYINEFVIYGQAMIEYNETWPFVHNVDPTLLVPFDCMKHPLT